MHQTRQLFDGRRLANGCERIFSRPGYQQKYLSFASVARSKRHARRVPSDVGNGQSKFGGDTTRRSGDIRALAEASLIGGKSRRRGRSQEDDHGLTFEINEFGVREPNSAEIGLAVFEKRSYGRTHTQTDRQTDRLKIKKYDQELLPGGFQPTFVPIVFEHFGCWGEKVEDYLKKLSQLSRDEDGKPNASTFKTCWRSVFSVCLQRSNARVIDRKIKIVSRDSNININSCR